MSSSEAEHRSRRGRVGTWKSRGGKPPGARLCDRTIRSHRMAIRDTGSAGGMRGAPSRSSQGGRRRPALVVAGSHVIRGPGRWQVARHLDHGNPCHRARPALRGASGAGLRAGLRKSRGADPEPRRTERGTARAAKEHMRSLHYLAFAVALLGAQACAADDGAPPPFASDGTASGQQASTDDEDYDDSEGAYDDSAPGDDAELEAEEGSPLDPAACSVTFTKHILPKLQNQWRCGASACHGNPGATSPVMDTKDAVATYTLLTTTTHAGKRLVDTSSTSPADSALHCLMQGTCGQRMPRQGVDALDLALVESWLKCRAPR